jgi:rSAM/selenodomain-associated transferase 1
VSGRTASGSIAASALAIMTKAPTAGSVKTRLAPPLTLGEAAALQACFLLDTAERIAALEAAGCAGVAVYTPEGAEALFNELLPAGFRLVPQRGEGLGDRLRNAAVDILAAGYASVCLVDSDSPTLPPAALTRAVAALEQPGERVVLGPADDGGYYLVGVKASCPRLFADIAWSTDRVLAQTVARARELGLEVELLPRWYDVDDGPSLRRLCEELLPDTPTSGASSGYRAPHTRDYLRQLVVVGAERIWPQRFSEGLRTSRMSP